MVFRTEIRWLYRITLYTCIFNITELYCLKISAPSVLLPYNKGLPTNYSVEITGAKPDNCFQWESAEPQIVQVIPIFSYPNCSSRAVISSRADLFDRKVTRISAVLKDGSEKRFYIDVITDVVSKIELSWQTDELIQEGAPQVLTLIARDELGHIFTSINGLEVQWKVNHYSEENAEVSEKEIIRLSRFDVSDYESPEENPWERRGLFSASVLAVPLHVGTSKISASLLLTGKSVFETIEITLNVLPNAKIYPASSLRLLPHASVKVRRKNLLNGQLEEIDKENFEPVVEDPEIITLSDLSHLSAKTYGNSMINYKCKDSNEGCFDLSMHVHVEKLDHIGIRISGGGFKNLQEMKTYEVILDLYDEKNNLIHGTDNMLFSVSFSTKLFHVIFTSKNGTYSVVQTIVPGKGKIRAGYKGVLLQDGTIAKDYIVSGSMDVTICQKLSIFPPQTLLPVLSKGKTFYDIPLTVTGGTGDYVWALSDYKMAKIIASDENKNAARLEVYGEIDLTVTATDRLNKNFISTAKVSIQPPIDIEAYPTVVEAEVGNVLIIPTALLGYENKGKNIVRKFDDCSKIEHTVDIVEKYVLSYEKESQVPSFGKGCMSLQFRCKYSGHTRVNIEYTVQTEENSNVTYKTTTVLACFKPLKPVQPVRVAVLALATAKEVAFEGGPRKWPLYKAGHYSELEASDPEKVKIELIKDPVRYNKDLTVFRVTCKALGENTLTFRIGNNPSATIQHPAKAEASIKFICAEPHSVHLKLYKKKTSKRQMDDNIVKVPFYGEKIFAVDIWVKDAMGRKFANISSLRVVWDVSDKTLAEPETHFDFMTHENAVAGYRKLSRDFKQFKMRSGTGDLTVGAKVTSYRKEVLSDESIIDYTEIQEISKSINLKLVSLRDLNPGGFETAKKHLEEDGYCEDDSCKNL